MESRNLDDLDSFKSIADDVKKDVMQDDKDDKDENGTLKDTAEANLEKRFSQQDDKINRVEALNQLMRDPDIQKVLEAKRKGNEIVISSKEKDNEDGLFELPSFKDDEGKDKSLEDLSNKELLELATGNVTKTISDLLDKKLKGVKGDISGVQKFVQQTETERIQREVVDVRKAAPDFDKYKEQIVELNRQNPGLTVEELYLLAKRRVEGKKKQDNTDTEKPTGQTSTKGLFDDDKTEYLGKQGMDALLEKALEGQDFNTG